MLARAELAPDEQRIAAEALGDAVVAPASILRIELSVGDFAQAVAFYRALLGGEGKARDEGHDFRCGSAVLSLTERPAAVPTNAGRVFLAVPDLKQRYAAARKAGALDLERISRQPSGEKSFCLRDPFGNALCFVDERSLGGSSRSSENEF